MRLQFISAALGIGEQMLFGIVRLRDKGGQVNLILEPRRTAIDLANVIEHAGNHLFLLVRLGRQSRQRSNGSNAAQVLQVGRAGLGSGSSGGNHEGKHGIAPDKAASRPV
jgi:hypothetical protein